MGNYFLTLLHNMAVERKRSSHSRLTDIMKNDVVITRS